MSSGYTIPGYTGPYNPNPDPPDNEARIVIYNYIPSLAFAGVALGLFAGALIGHAVLFGQGARGWGVFGGGGGGRRRRGGDRKDVEAGSREKLAAPPTTTTSGAAAAVPSSDMSTITSGTASPPTATTTTAPMSMSMSMDDRQVLLRETQSKSIRTFEGLIAFGCVSRKVAFSFGGGIFGLLLLGGDVRGRRMCGKVQASSLIPLHLLEESARMPRSTGWEGRGLQGFGKRLPAT